jgi:UDPglucose 6-dehydrogenase
VFYLHPWEIDPDQPRLPAGRLGRFRHYRNLHKTEGRLRALLADFRFKLSSRPPARAHTDSLRDSTRRPRWHGRRRWSDPFTTLPGDEMNVAIIGSGYVGLVTGACLADFGHTVVCVDSARTRVETLRSGAIPFYEPGLAEMVARNRDAGRLRFSPDLGEAVRASTVIFVAVGTPEGSNGEADVTQVGAVAEELARHLDGYRVIATKSTVPVGTGAWLRDYFTRALGPSADFDVVSNPEFLREGSAVGDFLRPDRVVIGSTSERATAVMRELYRPLYLIETPIVVTGMESAEMIKYASNAFLAVKIGFINEIANLCERVGADVHVVAKAMGLDRRIGPKFLHPGPGYGGSCFPKDTRALAALGANHGAPQRIVEAAIETNLRQPRVLLEKIETALGGVAGREVAVLGLSFKPNTDDVRESPALFVCRELAGAAARVRAFDPVAGRAAARVLDEVGAAVTFSADAYDAARGADALVIMTEWNEFRGLDLERLKEPDGASPSSSTRATSSTPCRRVRRGSCTWAPDGACRWRPARSPRRCRDRPAADNRRIRRRPSPCATMCHGATTPRAYVASRSEASAYHRRAWLDVVGAAFGHRTKYLVPPNRAGGSLGYCRSCSSAAASSGASLRRCRSSTTAASWRTRPTWSARCSRGRSRRRVPPADRTSSCATRGSTSAT